LPKISPNDNFGFKAAGAPKISDSDGITAAPLRLVR
jgi:hypothetical protein